MNKDQFLYYLKNPSLLDKSSLPDLFSVLNDYPYFQTAHLLLIKNLHNQEDIKYNNQLKVSSAYITDRKVLYNLVYSRLARDVEAAKSAPVFDEPIKAFVPAVDIPVSSSNEMMEPNLNEKVFENINTELTVDKSVDELQDVQTVAEVNISEEISNEVINQQLSDEIVSDSPDMKITTDYIASDETTEGEHVRADVTSVKDIEVVDIPSTVHTDLNNIQSDRHNEEFEEPVLAQKEESVSTQIEEPVSLNAEELVSAQIEEPVSLKVEEPVSVEIEEVCIDAAETISERRNEFESSVPASEESISDNSFALEKDQGLPEDIFKKVRALQIQKQREIEENLLFNKKPEECEPGLNTLSAQTEIDSAIDVSEESETNNDVTENKSDKVESLADKILRELKEKRANRYQPRRKPDTVQNERTEEKTTDADIDNVEPVIANELIDVSSYEKDSDSEKPLLNSDTAQICEPDVISEINEAEHEPEKDKILTAEITNEPELTILSEDSEINEPTSLHATENSDIETLEISGPGNIEQIAEPIMEVSDSNEEPVAEETETVTSENVLPIVNLTATAEPENESIADKILRQVQERRERIKQTDEPVIVNDSENSINTLQADVIPVEVSECDDAIATITESNVSEDGSKQEEIAVVSEVIDQVEDLSATVKESTSAEVLDERDNLLSELKSNEENLSLKDKELLTRALQMEDLPIYDSLRFEGRKNLFQNSESIADKILKQVNRFKRDRIAANQRLRPAIEKQPENENKESVDNVIEQSFDKDRSTVIVNEKFVASDQPVDVTEPTVTSISDNPITHPETDSSVDILDYIEQSAADEKHEIEISEIHDHELVLKDIAHSVEVSFIIPDADEDDEFVPEIEAEDLNLLIDEDLSLISEMLDETGFESEENFDEENSIDVSNDTKDIIELDKKESLVDTSINLETVQTIFTEMLNKQLNELLEAKLGGINITDHVLQLTPPVILSNQEPEFSSIQTVAEEVLGVAGNVDILIDIDELETVSIEPESHREIIESLAKELEDEIEKLGRLSIEYRELKNTEIFEFDETSDVSDENSDDDFQFDFEIAASGDYFAKDSSRKETKTIESTISKYSNINSSLVDKFLKGEHKISPAENTHSYKEVSKQSIEENEECISETLAKIYFRQGHYNKALLAYRKLSLKYPEKSIYFAAQIEKLKKIINE